MRALVVTGDSEYGWQDIAMPVPGPHEALVEIEVCGICNSTDSELVDGSQPYRPPVPFVLGHESVGKVVEVGAEVAAFKLGDRVTRAACILPGGERDGLRSGWGGFAEYGLVTDDPSHGARLRQVVLPSELPSEDGFLAISLAETRAFLEQIEELWEPVAGRGVVVVGTGIAGLTLMRWCREQGADPVIAIGRRPSRLILARKSGAHFAYASDDDALVGQIVERTGGGARFVFEAIGRPDSLPGLVPLMNPRKAFLAVYGAADPKAYVAAFEALPDHITAARPGPEEFRYTYRIGERLLNRDIAPGLWRTHLWQPDEIEIAFGQVAAGEVVKGAVVFR